MIELAGFVIGLLLTLFIYSYIIGDNPLYQIAVHILVGVAAAYALIIAVEEIFVPVGRRLLADPAAPENAIWAIPLALAFLLLFTWLRPVAWLGHSSVAFLAAVGAAVALIGVIAGTLIPQVLAGATVTGNPLATIVTALLTASVLLYFQFTGRVNPEGEVVFAGWQRAIRGIGRGVLMITFGALFAALLSTSLLLLLDWLTGAIDGVFAIVAGSIP
ncbi:MAG: hypothetical protein R3272_01255 [Candidatus Promineifilaceae bacterium]|nr:hypothetical protein [Candidatus Promineifilaceae bacterium]